MLVESYINQEYENGNKRIYVYVDIDDEKVIVNNKPKFERIVQNYLIDNQKKLLVPMTKSNPLVKQKALSLEQALKKKTEMLMKQYTT